LVSTNLAPLRVSYRFSSEWSTPQPYSYFSFFYVGGFHPSSTMMILSEQIKISKPYIPTTKVEGFTADFGKENFV
ncbi:MAG: hypothetical protein IJP91_08980, partial [Synergistaceae bacterium]|nr:hypothetical protein [Synergistaceae bacterium]